MGVHTLLLASRTSASNSPATHDASMYVPRRKLGSPDAPQQARFDQASPQQRFFFSFQSSFFFFWKTFHRVERPQDSRNGPTFSDFVRQERNILARGQRPTTNHSSEYAENFKPRKNISTRRQSPTNRTAFLYPYVKAAPNGAGTTDGQYKQSATTPAPFYTHRHNFHPFFYIPALETTAKPLSHRIL